MIHNYLIETHFVDSNISIINNFPREAIKRNMLIVTVLLITQFSRARCNIKKTT